MFGPGSAPEFGLGSARGTSYGGPVQPIEGKTIVITGASSGIGAAAARRLADMGATVAVVGRDAERTRSVAGECLGRGRAFVADFSSLDSVAALAAELGDAYPVIDVLANNAGFIAAKRALTVDGIESTIAVNHVAAFLLTRLLDANLKASPQARVVTTSSAAHRTGRLDRVFDSTARWSSWAAYGNSKLANIAFTTELDRRMQGTTVSANCFHPGLVRTGFGRDKGLLSLAISATGGLGMVSPEQGADTLVFLAAEDEPARVHGRYWVRRRPHQSANAGRDPKTIERLWTETAAVCAKYVH